MEPNGQDQQLGYLTGQVESINKRLDEHTEEEERHWRIFHEKLNVITAQLSMYNNFTKFLKLLGLSALALATFHWGDLKDLWK